MIYQNGKGGKRDNPQIQNILGVFGIKLKSYKRNEI